jgi:hypothetical protein
VFRDGAKSEVWLTGCKTRQGPLAQSRALVASLGIENEPAGAHRLSRCWTAGGGGLGHKMDSFVSGDSTKMPTVVLDSRQTVVQCRSTYAGDLLSRSRVLIYVKVVLGSAWPACKKTIWCIS